MTIEAMPPAQADGRLSPDGNGADLDAARAALEAELDAIESEEWRQSLHEVFFRRGPERVAQLLQELQLEAQKEMAPLPVTSRTPYVNTIPVEREPPYPGNRHLEQRIKSFVRWNAMAMVVDANNKSEGIGGHISTYASAATLYEVGFHHFFRGPNDPSGGDLVYIQGHASPGIYGRAYLEGRISEELMRNFRRELAEGGGLPSYPHPWLMEDFWKFPTVSMGLAPLMGIYQARFMRYPRRSRAEGADGREGLGLPRRRRDGRAGGARRDLAGGARAARQPDLRDQLQPAAPRRARARQRPDHPGAGGGLPSGRGLERDQGALGCRVGRAAGPRRRGPARPAHGRGSSTASTRSTPWPAAPTSASTSTAWTRACCAWSST